MKTYKSIKEFKPNLVPNEPKDGSFSDKDREELINKNGGIGNYHVSKKKDGCRLEFGVKEEILTRELKQPGSLLLRERFKGFNNLCLELNIIVDAEFYAHGMGFNEIFRFFSKTDVTCPKYKKELEKELEKGVKGKLSKSGGTISFEENYNGRSIDFLTTFHQELKAHIFDGIVADRPDLVGYEERIIEISKRIVDFLKDEDLTLEYRYSVMKNVVVVNITGLKTFSDLDYMYKTVIKEGWEGLVLTHKDHPYKYGRSTLKSGTIFKLKDDKKEFDGVVLEVEEATKAKEGTERTTNELGRSVTSKKKDDREPSGLAKGFVVQYEDAGEFTVSLRGFDNEAKRELLENASKYIGKHFKYTGMPPVKDFPRHAYFDYWREEK